jgi:hypothetical protein
MSKSTPLSSLPSLQENQQPSNESSAYNENENQLVNEILQEIEGKQPNDNANMGSPQQPEGQPNMPMPRPQMAQANQMGMPPISQEEMMHREMQRQAMMRAQQAQLAQLEEEELSFQDRIISMLKLPAVVAAICILLALPQVTTMLNGFLLGKESLSKYANFLVPVIKGLLGAGLYFGATQVV